MPLLAFHAFRSGLAILPMVSILFSSSLSAQSPPACEVLAAVPVPTTGSQVEIGFTYNFPNDPVPPETVGVIDSIDATNRLVPRMASEGSVTWKPVTGGRRGTITLQLDRNAVAPGAARALVFTWTQDGTEHQRCIQTVFTAQPPGVVSTTWVIDGTEQALLPATAPFDLGRSYVLHFDGFGLWKNADVDLGRLSNVAKVASRTFTAAAGAKGDRLQFRLIFSGPPSGGIYPLALSVKAGWSSIVPAASAKVTGDPPMITELVPTEIPAAANTLDLLIKGSYFADPFATVTYTSGGPKHTTTTIAQGVYGSELGGGGCTAQNCFHLARNVSGIGTDGTINISLTNFDGQPSAVRSLRVSQRPYDVTQIQAISAEPRWVRGGQPTDLYVTESVPNGAGPISEVWINGAMLSPMPAIVPDGRGETLKAITIPPPIGGADSMVAAIDVVRAGGFLGRGRIVVWADPIVAPFAVYGAAGKAQPLTVRGQHLIGLTAIATNGITFKPAVSSGSNFELVVTPHGAGPAAISLFRGTMRVQDLDVPFVAPMPTSSVIRWTAGSKSCNVPQDKDSFDKQLKIPNPGALCVRIVRTPGVNLSSDIMDTVVVVAKQDGKTLTPTAPRAFAVTEGTGDAVIEVPLAGITPAQPFSVEVTRNGQGPAIQSAAIGLKLPYTPFVALSVVSFFIGPHHQPIQEERLATAASPQLGFWITPDIYSTDFRLWFALLTSKRVYCDGSSKDVPSIAMGTSFYRALTLGVGTPVEDKTVPGTCPSSSTTTPSTGTNSSPPSIAFKRLLLLIGFAIP